MELNKFESLKKLANGPDWEDVRSVLLDIVNEVRDVNNVEDLEKLTGFKISLGALYLGKVIAGKKILDLVHTVDVLKDKEIKQNKEQFE